MHTTEPPAASPQSVFPAPVVRVLVCPVCRERLSQAGKRFACGNGHSFDQARQGYLALRAGKATKQLADTADMVAARERFLTGGHYRPLADRIAQLIAEHAQPDTVAVDLAGGTGYYLAALLDRLPAGHGICLDLSTYALRRAARAHPRAVAVGADLRDPFPLADRSIGIATSIFGPRNVPEIERVLRPDGILLVATPNPAHLREVIDPLGMLRVQEAKRERLAESLAGFTQLDTQEVDYGMDLDHAQLEALASMGPSAHHSSREELIERLRRLPATTRVTVSVSLGRYRPSQGKTRRA